jgi:DNA repair protein RadC
MIPGERPQERLQRLGPAALGDTELLAMVLRSGAKGHDVLTLAARLLTEAGSLDKLITWGEPEFREHRSALKGIGRVKALQLITIMEIARRVIGRQAGEAPLLDTPAATASYLLPVCAGLAVEKFWVLCLNRKNRLLKRVESTSGTATTSLAHPREVFRTAIREGAVSIICAHNHPSGDPHPSAQDIQVTRQLREASRVLGIDLIDHIIVGRKEADPTGAGFYSFREAGLM